MNAITSKGQVTIPKRVRDRMGLVPGDKLGFDRLPHGRVTIFRAEADGKVAPVPPSRFEALWGIIDLGMSVDDFMTMRSPRSVASRLNEAGQLLIANVVERFAFVQPILAARQGRRTDRKD